MTRRYEVFFTPEAETDIHELYDYIAEHGSADRALNYMSELKNGATAWKPFPSAESFGMIFGPDCAS